MVKPSRSAIAKSLKPHGFDEEHVDDDLILVRPSEKKDLFERIEVAFAGREQDVIVLSMSLSVVRWARTQYKGLILRGGLQELCSNPDSGKVRFASRAEESGWIERFAILAPQRVHEFAVLRGDELLLATQAARDRASTLYDTFIVPTLASRDPDRDLMKGLTTQQRAQATNLLARPLVIGSPQLRWQYETAIAALVLGEDEDVLSVANKPGPEATSALERISRMGEMPLTVMWKTRLLVDLMLRCNGSR